MAIYQLALVTTILGASMRFTYKERWYQQCEQSVRRQMYSFLLCFNHRHFAAPDRAHRFAITFHNFWLLCCVHIGTKKAGALCSIFQNNTCILDILLFLILSPQNPDHQTFLSIYLLVLLHKLVITAAIFLYTFKGKEFTWASFFH